MPRVLLACLLAYAAASLFHHLHNAAFLDQYPNLPAWLSPMWALAHYLVAPVSAHTLAMNLSIWLEAAAAAGLLFVAVSSGRRGP
jgi:hypothetical protein